MSLNRRFALTFGGLGAIIVIALVLAVSVRGQQDLRSTADAQLATRARLFNALPLESRAQVLEATQALALDASSSERLSVQAFTLQVVSSTGAVSGSSSLPIDLGVVTDVIRTGNARYRTIDLAGRTLRVLTTLSSDRSVLQIATNVTALEQGLVSLRRTALVAGLVGVGAAVGLGTLSARRLVRPIKDLTKATRNLSTGENLPKPIEVHRRDEIGDLAGAFNAMVAELQVSRAQQERLVADASHELRTPLTSLRLKLDFLATEPDIDQGQHRKLLEAATAELESLTELIAEVTDLATLNTNLEAPELVDLGELVEDAADRARLTTGRTVTTSTTHTLVQARPAMVRRALSNLIVNAHKYSASHEPIEIHESNGRIEVHDHGPGISAAERERAFDRFFRSDQTRHIPGTGIGLAIVKQVADAHAGTVWIADSPSGATIVGFALAPSPPSPPPPS